MTSNAEDEPFNRLEDVFDSWALQCIDEDHAHGAETTHRFIEERLPILIRSTQSGDKSSSTPSSHDTALDPQSFSLLELGCASGHFLRQMAALPGCVRAEGMDVSPRMLWKARYFFSDRTPSNVRYHHASNLLEFCPSRAVGRDELGHNPDGDDHSNDEREPWEPCDVVASFATLYYVKPLERLTGEKIRKWLRPGGLFLAGMDFFEENKDHCGHWGDMLRLEMDLRSSAEYKDYFSSVLGLERVEQAVFEYPRNDGDKGTLFTWGFLPHKE